MKRHSRVTAHRSFDGHAERSAQGCGPIRQIIFKLLRHLIFKMTPTLPLADLTHDNV
jgi:hypothetical protein